MAKAALCCKPEMARAIEAPRGQSYAGCAQPRHVRAERLPALDMEVIERISAPEHHTAHVTIS